MSRRDVINHVLVVGGVLLVVGLLGLLLGLNNDTWWLLGAVAVVLHVGVFAALITWVVQRVRRLRKERVES